MVDFFKGGSELDGFTAKVSSEIMSSSFKSGEGLVPLKKRLSRVRRLYPGTLPI
jgi:hypothetical protein